MSPFYSNPYTPYYFGRPRLISHYILNPYIMLGKKLPTDLKGATKLTAGVGVLLLF
jgi:hypothetical protein